MSKFAVILLLFTTSLARETSAAAEVMFVPKKESSQLVESSRNRCHAVKRWWTKTSFTQTDFEVMGVNLGQYRLKLEDEDPEDELEVEELPKSRQNSEPFELYEDFNICDVVTGDETWWQLIKLTGSPKFSSLIFYEDKVALKRWLPANGFPIPRLFALKYASELTPFSEVENQKQGILSLLPQQKMAIYDLLPKNQTDYVAKPTHKAESYEVWQVKYDINDGTLEVSERGHPFQQEVGFNHMYVADSLARALYEKADEWEAWALLNVKPGVVVEERFTNWEDNGPAHEFKVITIWGRAWVVQWLKGTEYGHFNWVYRDGTMVENSSKESLAEWVDWPHIVEIAERLGANKDLFRVDIFAGVPAGSPALRPGASAEERQAAVEYVVSELEFEPETPLWPELQEDGVRLWMAGYNMLNYTVVPNKEVPRSFFEPSHPFLEW